MNIEDLHKAGKIKLTDRAFWVYRFGFAYMGRMYGDAWFPYPITRIMIDTGKAKLTVRQAISELTAEGLIERRGENNRQIEYRVIS